MRTHGGGNAHLKSKATSPRPFRCTRHRSSPPNLTEKIPAFGAGPSFRYRTSRRYWPGRSSLSAGVGHSAGRQDIDTGHGFAAAHPFLFAIYVFAHLGIHSSALRLRPSPFLREMPRSPYPPPMPIRPVYSRERWGNAERCLGPEVASVVQLSFALFP